MIDLDGNIQKSTVYRGIISYPSPAEGEIHSKSCSSRKQGILLENCSYFSGRISWQRVPDVIAEEHCGLMTGAILQNSANSRRSGTMIRHGEHFSNPQRDLIHSISVVDELDGAKPACPHEFEKRLSLKELCDCVKHCVTTAECATHQKMLFSRQDPPPSPLTIMKHKSTNCARSQIENCLKTVSWKWKRIANPGIRPTG
jgi:hypothetical protein